MGYVQNSILSYKGKGEREREVVCGQVWWPILGICPLHLTHPSAHSQQWTHTWSSGQPFCGARGAVGGSVPCSRVSPQSWYWRWREHLLFTPPTDNPCRTWESNLQPLGYKSNSLTIRPRLPVTYILTVAKLYSRPMCTIHCMQIFWMHGMPRWLNTFAEMLYNAMCPALGIVWHMNCKLELFCFDFFWLIWSDCMPHQNI